MPRYCTIPSILGLREWFEDNYGTCCKAHDNHYISGMKRASSDWLLLYCMKQQAATKNVFKRFVVHYPFCYLTYAFVRAFGWVHYGK